ncbi:hypothetical protein CEP10_06890 [Cylindrospermopsis raciborskii S07]|uniref:Uncharacterized protein n=2 Tax=Cylindrospermopsis raciborskii TaxID=77022 RepID=A0A853MA09_9CYAN|nr:hypothetical protein [Cylindrospermopsis raciborskii]EFA68397.1 hypothetical protein CRC_03072 [Cylindrospermopsis raciborskii CS-505]PNK08718.1 hypothetical protein CEP10_06890 [Cylindrospermopsis raciborskii S07]PNK15615.1 hypothetical protein CEP09_09750 [Cylindrospermopsis raciborskii S06]PNK18115.1 hypothetical protein CEP08_09575 [Cylindrospermopsis raciborskii S05]PNK18798.1 hypothetical protein CEP07_07370 [Cylindrospermopsis raciborskii S01]
MLLRRIIQEFSLLEEIGNWLLILSVNMAFCTGALGNIDLELGSSFLRAGLVEDTGKRSPYGIGEESGLNHELFVETADLGNADIMVMNAKFSPEQVAC